MTRCVICGCSRYDPDGLGCALCGGAHGPRWEQVHIDDGTKAKLLAHADELKGFGVTLEQQQLLQKDAGLTMSAIGLGLGVVESIHPGTLRSLILFLRDLAIPQEQILRLRLDEPETISEILQEATPARKPSRPARRKQPAKSSKKEGTARRKPTAKKSKKQSAKGAKHPSKRSKKR
jgi:hypothetical protein